MNRQMDVIDKEWVKWQWGLTRVFAGIFGSYFYKLLILCDLKVIEERAPGTKAPISVEIGCRG